MIHIAHDHVNRTLCGLDSREVATQSIREYLHGPSMIGRKALQRRHQTCARCARHARRRTVRAA